MGVAWHSKWENFGLITSAEGLVRELVVYDKIALVSPQTELSGNVNTYLLAAACYYLQLYMLSQSLNFVCYFNVAT